MIQPGRGGRLDFFMSDLFAPVVFPWQRLYDVLARDFPRAYGLLGVIKMAEKNVTKLTATERDVVGGALDMYAKSLERAKDAAKDVNIANAYRDAHARVVSLKAKVMSLELEL